ncbi:defensin-like protein [Hordeum vulgare subsp. vulgare]|uniref:Predicted protein n=1 Tax=Hordeum vulgare subsp. vulgare TaxID=112509 RepID=F2EA80_HORVV|nr:defensin-like protein [Hordeum vulgare subsp. vulgare]KAI4968791.1 hypothetical protein ZWY2020_046121 [Hordeum vulgare]BAK04252.1 predicted protein [Hordeum vulgare subsp. vulgare]
MALCMKNIGKRLLGDNKVLICLWAFWLVTLLVLSSEEMGSDACEKQISQTWYNTTCIIRGTCNKYCRNENFDSGICKELNYCFCYRNCTAGSI